MCVGERISVTRSDDFQKLWATNFLVNVAQVFGDFFGYIEKHHSLSDNTVAIFWPALEGNWAIFSTTSGHSGENEHLRWIEEAF